MSGLFFKVPKSATDEERQCLMGAKFHRGDEGPFPASVAVHEDFMQVLPAERRSGSVEVCWPIESIGRMPLRTASLIQREEPYRLLVELARGESTEVRNEFARLQMQKQSIPISAINCLRSATKDLRHSVFQQDDSQANILAVNCLRGALQASELAVLDSCRQLLRSTVNRDQKQLGCAIYEVVPQDQEGRFLDLFRHVTLPVCWNQIEEIQGERDWKNLDERVEWCLKRGLSFTVGPIVDFAEVAMPRWLKNWVYDSNILLTFLLDFVESCINRYGGQVTSWATTSRTNSSNFGGMSDDQSLWIALQLLEAARNVDPTVSIVIGFDQPWGDPTSGKRRSRPSQCVDMLLRADLPIASVEVDLAMGLAGSCVCRTLSSFSRALDEFTELSIPLRLRMGFPSNQAGSVERTGMWRRSPDPQLQAEWLHDFGVVALSKPFVELLTWIQYSDSDNGPWKGAGLVTQEGTAKPAYAALETLARQLSNTSGVTI